MSAAKINKTEAHRAAMNAAGRALMLFSELPFVVEHRDSVSKGFEPIAAFNVERVATMYASSASAENPKACYRVIVASTGEVI